MSMNVKLINLKLVVLFSGFWCFLVLFSTFWYFLVLYSAFWCYLVLVKSYRKKKRKKFKIGLITLYILLLTDPAENNFVSSDLDDCINNTRRSEKKNAKKISQQSHQITKRLLIVGDSIVKNI